MLFDPTLAQKNQLLRCRGCPGVEVDSESEFRVTHQSKRQHELEPRVRRVGRSSSWISSLLTALQPSAQRVTDCRDGGSAVRVEKASRDDSERATYSSISVGGGSFVKKHSPLFGKTRGEARGPS